MKSDSNGIKTLKIIGNIILWIFVLSAALMTIIAFSAQKNEEGLANILGKIPVTVLSDSMKGTFDKGSLIIDNALTSEEKANLAVDDIITFYTDLNKDGKKELNTHRIISVREEDGYTFYTTKGDNQLTNPVADDEIRYDMVAGKYTGTKISGLGSVLSFLQTPTAFLLCIVLPLCLFFLFEIYRFIVITMSIKNRKTTIADEEEIKKKAIEEYIALQKENDKVENAEELK